MYYPKQKLIFVHIPKTGGSTLEWHLGAKEHPGLFEKMKNGHKMAFLTNLYKRYQLEPKVKNKRTHNIHRTIYDYDDIINEGGYNIISFVRNPFSQIKSLYTMTSEDSKKRGRGYPTWEDYILRDVKRPHFIFGQKNWLDFPFILGNGEYNVKIYPFDYYTDCVSSLGVQYGFNPDFGVKLWSTKPKYDYTPKMIEKVFDLYADSYYLWKKVKEHWEEHKQPYDYLLREVA